MYKTTEIKDVDGTSFVTTTSHEEPYFYYETGNYFIHDDGTVSEFELYRRAEDKEQALINHRKLVGIIRDTIDSYYERRWDK